MAGGIDDVGARQEQEGRLGQGRDALDLAMSVWMVVVRRFAADPYGCVSQHGGAAIERRMGRFGQDAQAAGQDADRELQRGQQAAREYGTERDAFFGVSHIA